MDEAIKQAVRVRAEQNAVDWINRGGRPQLPEDEARAERTTIRWKPGELDEVKRYAADMPLGETIRRLVMDAIRAEAK